MAHTLSIISANDLRSGLNVYFVQGGGDSCWDTDVSRASVYEKENLTPAFDLAKQDMAKNIVVDCLTVAVDDNHIPLTTREKIRSSGPSSKYGHGAV